MTEEVSTFAHLSNYQQVNYVDPYFSTLLSITYINPASLIYEVSVQEKIFFLNVCTFPVKRRQDTVDVKDVIISEQQCCGARD
jgi:hypothetical protein